MLQWPALRGTSTVCCTGCPWRRRSGGWGWSRGSPSSRSQGWLRLLRRRLALEDLGGGGQQAVWRHRGWRWSAWRWRSAWTGESCSSVGIRREGRGKKPRWQKNCFDDDLKWWTVWIKTSMTLITIRDWWSWGVQSAKAITTPNDKVRYTKEGRGGVMADEVYSFSNYLFCIVTL